MHRLTRVLVLAAVTLAIIGGTVARADEAVTSGKAAYHAEQFEQARVLFERAAARNPRDQESLLWLGKANYQLGRLNAAMAAWRRAPNEVYARKMLKALSADVGDVDARIGLIDLMLEGGLHDPARAEGESLLRVKALTEAQRAKILANLAEAHLGLRRPDRVHWYVAQLKTKYPGYAPKAPALMLLSARAKLLQKGAAVDVALATLETIVAKHAKTPQAVRAAYELAVFELDHGAGEGRFGPLAKWAAQHGDDPLAGPAGTKLIRTLLAISKENVAMSADASLHPADVKALELLATQRRRPSTRDAAGELTPHMLTHFIKVYADRGAHAAAATALTRLLPLASNPRHRLAILTAMDENDLAPAIAALAEQAKRGTLPKDMPAAVAGVVVRIRQVEAKRAGADAYGRLVALAEQLYRIGEMRVGPPTGQALSGPAKWAVDIAAGAAADLPDSRRATGALRVIDSVILAMLRLGDDQCGRRPGGKTPPADVAAFGLIKQRYAMSNVDQSATLTEAVLAHLGRRCVSVGTEVALAGTQSLLAMNLPPADRRTVLIAAAQYGVGTVLKSLTEQAIAGRLPAKMPATLSAIRKRYDTLNASATPSHRAWGHTAALAERVRGLAALLPARTAPAGAVGPYEWAVQIALHVIAADGDPQAVAVAIKTVAAVRDAYVTQKAPTGLALAAAVNDGLIAAAPARSAHATAAQWKRVDLLAKQAAWAFADNTRRGLSERNAKLSDVQGQLLATLEGLLRADVRKATQARVVLDGHLQPWLKGNHYGVVEAAYDRLTPALSDARKRTWRLEMVKLWVRQVNQQHNRLLSAGLMVPHELDPVLAKALKRCYDLQVGLAEGDPFGAQVRQIWRGIVAIYEGLEYYDVAEKAVAVKGAKPADAADAFAQLQLARLHHEQAGRELTEMLKHYKGAEKVALTDAYAAALAEYRKFLTDRPAHPLGAQAVGSIFGIARLFGQHEAFDASARIYSEFADFAAKDKVLSQAPIGGASTTERARLAAAATLYVKAKAALAKETAAAKVKPVVPTKISPEFGAAVAAYKDFIQANPDSAVLAGAISQIMAVAIEYANIDAWDVAEGIYADVLAAGLPLHRPERLEFARGLCRVGKVMPAHARSVLQTLGAVTTGHGWGDGGGPVNSRTIAGTGSVAFGGDKLASRPALPKPTTPGGRPAKIVAGTNKDKDDGEALPAAAAFDAKPSEEIVRKADQLALATIRQHQQRRAMQVASLRDSRLRQVKAKTNENRALRGQIIIAPVLSGAEIQRQAKALASAYEVFKGLRVKYPRTVTAAQVRGEIMVMVGHWRLIGQWERAALLADTYLKDNPTDRELPQLRLAIARDYLSWATQPVTNRLAKEEMLADVGRRFGKARTQLVQIAKQFPEDTAIVHEAQWGVANSFLTQARVVDAISSTLARGQYVRGARELRKIAAEYHDHPQIAAVPQMLANVAQTLAGRRYFDEAIIVWNELIIHYPTHALADQSALRIAQTYQTSLKRPLPAAEAYLELNFQRGGNDPGVQNTIFQIGTALKGEKRWVESLHVLETFVDSFPRHPSAGQALTLVGQIHQANEAWDEAIAAYARVMEEFPAGAWVREARWATAECTINLSRWREAMASTATYQLAYPKDVRQAEAARRIGILKDLSRYQGIIDEEDHDRAFDAQYQIAEIMLTKLANPVKAIIEYRKVAAKWPKSHWADDAMFKVGLTYLSMGETDRARLALLAVAEKYPTSPLADDALYRIGQSYEQEVQQYATVTRATTLNRNKAKAQRFAYEQMANARDRMEGLNDLRVAAYRRAGKQESAELEVARGASQVGQFNLANASTLAEQAMQVVEVLTATQLADRQDKINAALRKAVSAYQEASAVPTADKADESLLQMARIYADKLKDPDAAMRTYLEIVRQFSGNSVAEDASWRIAQYHEQGGRYAEAIKAYEAFLRNYRRSPRAAAAQFAVAENFEHLREWVKAMDAYTNYINNFPAGPMVKKAKEQIDWIKTYRLL